MNKRFTYSAAQQAALFGRTGDNFTFLGSCFFFIYKNEVLVCTAEHNLKSITTGKFFVVNLVGSKVSKYPAVLVHSDSDYDVALLKPDRHPTPITIQLSSKTTVAGNDILMAYEFSSTQNNNRGRFEVNPAARMGNCTRIFENKKTFGKAGVDMLEISFPALKGASGAAILQVIGTKLIAHGMIVASTEQELLPAQIETVLDEKNDIMEERKYFLPQTAAVNSTHIIKVVEDYLTV